MSPPCRRLHALPLGVQLTAPAILCAPYARASATSGIFHWGWLVLYALLPVALAALLEQSKRYRNGWRELLVLAVLGLIVDLRLLESAWPAHLAIFNKILLLDAGLYGFTLLHQLDGVGFDLRLRMRDAVIGLREVAVYTPLALALGLSLGFLHVHRNWPGLAAIAAAWIFTFLSSSRFPKSYSLRLDAESYRTAPGTHSLAAAYLTALWTGALQQARGPFQLALRPDGGVGRDLLWGARGVSSAGRRRRGYHSRLCRHDLVSDGLPRRYEAAEGAGPRGGAYLK